MCFLTWLVARRSWQWLRWDGDSHSALNYWPAAARQPDRMSQQQLQPLLLPPSLSILPRPRQHINQGRHVRKISEIRNNNILLYTLHLLFCLALTSEKQKNANIWIVYWRGGFTFRKESRKWISFRKTELFLNRIFMTFPSCKILRVFCSAMPL